MSMKAKQQNNGDRVWQVIMSKERLDRAVAWHKNKERKHELSDEIYTDCDIDLTDQHCTRHYNDWQ